MNSIEDLLQRLEKAKGDIRAQSALTTEFLIMARPEAERETLRAGLDAAAVLHWFDAQLLEQVLEIPQDEARRQLNTLKEHSFVEHYRGELDLQYNLQQSTRLGWRIRFASERPEPFRALSLRASSCFVDNPAPSGRIEWVYHLLCGNPDLAASELENLDREWSGSARPEDRSALAAALQELVETKLIDGRARARSLLAIAWSRTDRQNTARLAEIAAEALRFARITNDKSAEGDAKCLEGHVLEAQGDLTQAQAAFDQYLAISRRLAEQDPSNAGWQRELAVAYNRVGGVLQAQGRLEAAQAAFDQNLVISRRLAEQDPSNADWQRDLALACLRNGRIVVAANLNDIALPLYEESLRIFTALVQRAPGFVQWAQDMKIVEAELTALRGTIASSRNGAADGVQTP
jgi:tetratricopeptide (TPR) repeat protein